MDQEQDEVAARELTLELRRVADTILDLEARGQLLAEAPRLLRLLGDARSRVFAWEVRVARRQPEAPASSAAMEPPQAPESGRVVDEALQREEEAAREWNRRWERQGESEL